MTTIQGLHKKLAFLALGGSAIAALAGPAGAADVISLGSPFSTCAIGGTPSSTNYDNAEVEPWVAVNPANPANFIAGWQQDRWSDGGAKSLMAAYTLNGDPISNVAIPNITACALGSGTTGTSGGLSYERASDPWATFSKDGDIAYYMSLVFDNDPAPGISGNNAMLVSRSFDGGATWEPTPKFLINSFNQNDFNDKNSMTADPFYNNIAYAVWDKLANVAGKHDGAADARGRRRAAIDRGGVSENNRYAYRGPAMFAHTTNGGDTWSPARVIYDPGVSAQTIGNMIVVQPGATGAVLDFYTNIAHNGATSMGFVKSTDKGANFGAGRTAFKTALTRNGTVTPEAKESVRDGNILFDAAVDPDNGNLYLVWQDAKNQNIDRVHFSMSTDGGDTWSIPVMIAKTPYSSNKLKMQSFIPSVEVGPNHRVYVTYYDFRNDTASGEMTDYWAISCKGNCSLPTNWGNEKRLTSESFDMLNAPIARGHFLGDYMGLARQGTVMRAVFGIATTFRHNEIVTATFATP